MAKSLIITEKPSVAQEFARILNVSGRRDGYLENEEYVITWCVGHLVEMVYPEEYDIKYKKWRLEDLPFLPQEYRYNVIAKVRRQYDVVHGMLHRADIDTVYWAGDAGKEGQTIEENIRRFGGVRKGMRELRVWIDSQTKEEILRGLREAKPMSEYDNLAKSGVMRTIEDYAMGINFSRVMSVRYGKLLNDAAGTKTYTAIAVGRVMTCVLGMVVVREREIRDFTETPFYRVAGEFACGDGTVGAEWKAVEGSAYHGSPLLYRENGFRNRKDAQKLIDGLSGERAVVSSLEKGTQKKRAPLLFNLAELQAECAKRFKISPDETLAAAQVLYEKKLTTYPRTDARVLSSAVAKEISRNIGGLKGCEPVADFAEQILNEGWHKKIARTGYTDDARITDHYAIIPTGQLTELASVNSLQRRVFELIVRRFLSIFYPPAEYQTIRLAVKAGKEMFFASAKTLKVPGYLKVAGIYGAGQTGESRGAEGAADARRQDAMAEEGADGQEENAGLAAAASKLKKGDVLEVNGYAIREGRTSPPRRYTSGSMVLAMENAGQLIEDEELRAQIKGSGIGTSATRAEIIQKLVRVGYLALNKKTQVLTPERLGEMIFEVVSMTVPALLNPEMTASWEKGLDGITRGTVVMEEYRTKLEDFIRRETVSMMEHDLTRQVAEKIRPFIGKEGRGIAARKSLGLACPVCGGDIGTTPFGYGCGNYKKDGSGCGFAIGAIAGRQLGDEDVTALLTEGRTGTIRDFRSKTGKKFDACIALVKEDGKCSLKFDFEHAESRKVRDVKCPVCGGEIAVTPFGYGCASYAKDDPSACRFSIGKIAGKKLSMANLRELLTKGRTGVIGGFQSKAGGKFEAALKLTEDKRVVFDFPDRPRPTETTVKCPVCGELLKKSQWYYECECGFKVSHTVARVELSEDVMKELLETGRTGEKITGFLSKAGKTFDAHLKFLDRQIQFDFGRETTAEHKGQEGENGFQTGIQEVKSG